MQSPIFPIAFFSYVSIFALEIYVFFFLSAIFYLLDARPRHNTTLEDDGLLIWEPLSFVPQHDDVPAGAQKDVRTSMLHRTYLKKPFKLTMGHFSTNRIE